MVNLIKVRDEIKSLDSKVELMAVSKTHPYSSILECYELGQRLFGENRYQEIAEKLFLSVRTVESHKTHIMQKLNLKTTIDMIKFGIRNNLIEI